MLFEGFWEGKHPASEAFHFCQMFSWILAIHIINHNLRQGILFLLRFGVPIGRATKETDGDKCGNNGVDKCG